MFWKIKTQSAKICLNFNFRGGGGVLKSQNPKCQDLLKFQFLGWVGGWGEGVLKSQNPKKCQDLLKFQLGGGSVLESQNPKCQDLPKFQFWWGVFWKVKTQSAKICLNFNWGGQCSGKSKPKVPRSA